MSGSTRSKKSPLKEIPDAVNNKFLELEAELARQKAATENRFAELSAQIAEFRANQQTGYLDQQDIRAATTVQDKETGELAKTAKDSVDWLEAAFLLASR